mgnify:CR=1 FL=1
MGRRWETVGETWRDAADAGGEGEIVGGECERGGDDMEWEEGVQDEEEIEREWEDRLAREEVEAEIGREAFGDG